MLEPISTTIGLYCLVGYTSLNAYTGCGSAVSAEAQIVTKAASALVRAAEESLSLFGGKSASISQLRKLTYECAMPDWDGYGANPIDLTSLQNAENFIRALPEGIRTPECAPEPDGSISLDWIQNRHRLFSLSVGPSNRLAYAWLDGTDKGHGVARFDVFSIPPRVLAEIQSILRQGNAPLPLA